MAFGLLTTGFVPKVITGIVEELGESWKTIFGARVNLDPRSRNGQIIAAFSERLADLWDLGQAVYSAFDPTSATDDQLDKLGALTGSTRNPATYSTVTLVVTGTNGTLLPIGRIVSVDGTDGAIQFETIEEITIGASPTDVLAQATETGPVIGNAGTLTVIETPVAGWTSVTNVLDADVGSDIESNADFRYRRAASLRAQGSSTVDGIRSRLLEVESVTSVNVFENASSTTSDDGLPPNSFEAVVDGGNASEIREAIFTNKPAGIETYGSTSGSVVDSQGESHTVKFSRPTEVDVYVTLELVVDAALYPLDGDDQVEQAIVDFGDTFPPGKDVVASKLAAIALGIDGVMDAVVKIGLAATPTLSTTLKMNLREVAMFDTSRTIVEAEEGTT